MTTMSRAMLPEATVLYYVTAVVVVGLALWVGYVLATAKAPWSRPQPLSPGSPHRAADVPIPPDSDPGITPAAPSDADSTAPATPVALAGEHKSKVLGGPEGS